MADAFSRNLEDWKSLQGHSLLNNVSYLPLQRKHNSPFLNSWCDSFCGSQLQGCTTPMVTNLVMWKLSWHPLPMERVTAKQQRVGEGWQSCLEVLLQVRACAPTMAGSMCWVWDIQATWFFPHSAGNRSLRGPQRLS